MSQPVVKVVLVGNDGVGKSSIVVTTDTQGEFPDELPVQVVDNLLVRGIAGEGAGRNVVMNLWDTAGHEDYDRLRPLAYPETDFNVVCFSLVDQASFDAVRTKWVPELIENQGTHPQFFLVGTKRDLREDRADDDPPAITRRRGEQLARETSALEYFEVSAKENQGLTELFLAVGRRATQPGGTGPHPRPLTFCNVRWSTSDPSYSFFAIK